MPMSTPEKLEELRNLEIKLRSRYSRLFMFFLIITILLIILIVIVAIGIIFLGLGNNWALMSFEDWMVSLSSLIVIFIFLEFVFYLHYHFLRKNLMGLEKPQPEFIDGKKVYAYTFPRGVEGGVYSKTYIEIDHQSILRLRNLMIPPEELW